MGKQNTGTRPPASRAGTISGYILAPFKAAIFSHDVGDYFSGTRKEAVWSFLVPLFACFYISYFFYKFILCNHLPCFSARDSITTYIGGFLTVFMLALPRFLIFYGLVWQLCRMFGNTDRYKAFIAANNLLYIPFLFKYTFSAYIAHNYGHLIEHPEVWPIATTFYLVLIVNFIAISVLKMRQEVAWIVPVCFLFAHAVVRMVTGKHGMMFVF